MAVAPRNRLTRSETLDAHESLAAVLPRADREWLARMADVLPFGWVVHGMATPRRGGIVHDPSRPSGLRLVVPPAGPGAVRPPARPSRGRVAAARPTH